MVVSLPSSLTGVVRKKDVSDYFYVKAGAGGKKNRGGKGRYYDDEAIGDISLMDLFKEGQVNLMRSITTTALVCAGGMNERRVRV